MTGLGVPGVTPHCTFESLTQKAEPTAGLTKSLLPAAGVYNDAVMTLIRCPLSSRQRKCGIRARQHDNMLNS